MMNYFSFCIGIIWAYLDEKKYIRLEHLYFAMCISIILLVIKNAETSQVIFPLKIMWNIDTYTRMIILVGVVFLLKNTNFHYLKSILDFVGEYSFEIYLVEGMWCQRLVPLFKSSVDALSFIYFIILSIASGYLLRRCFELLIHMGSFMHKKICVMTNKFN